MSQVRIPPVLRETVGGERELEATGATVTEVLDDLLPATPPFASGSPSGALSPFVNVYVNGRTSATPAG